MDVDKAKMDELLELLEELVINKIRIEKMQEDVIDSRYKRILANEIQIVSEIQEVIKDIQTITMKSIYERLRNYIASSSYFFCFNGNDSKLDNFSEEQLYEILKNFVDYILSLEKYHGEKKVTISSSNDSTSLIITIKDFRKAAANKSLIQKFNNDFITITYLSEEEVDELEEQTDMSISAGSIKNVYRAAKSINASVEIKNQGDIDEEIIIIVPIASSIIKAQLVQLDNQIYAIPVDYIEKVMRINTADKKVSCNKQFIMYMGRIVPVISIYEELNLKNSSDVSSYVVLKYKDKMIALPVHSLLEQTDIVLRPKPQAINEVLEFKGTTILGDGNVTMVFDIPYLVEND